MFYDTAQGHGLPHDPVKALIAPRPIGWICAMSAAGETNLAPYSFFNQVSDRPHMVMFSSAGRKDAFSFIEETGEFTCSIVCWEQRDAMNRTSAPLPRGQSEFEYAGCSRNPPCWSARPGSAAPRRRWSAAWSGPWSLRRSTEARPPTSWPSARWSASTSTTA